MEICADPLQGWLHSQGNQDTGGPASTLRYLQPSGYTATEPCMFDEQGSLTGFPVPATRGRRDQKMINFLAPLGQAPSPV